MEVGDYRFFAGWRSDHFFFDTQGAVNNLQFTAKALLPDILMFDPTRPASFGENGRALTDDAADAFVRILTNGTVTGDGVGAHHDLLAEFPYLGAPHKAFQMAGA
jgi:hypothetical protein